MLQQGRGLENSHASTLHQQTWERGNARTRNDRRVTTPANAVAAAFRSYMNSQPVVKDGEVGLPTDDNDV